MSVGSRRLDYHSIFDIPAPSTGSGGIGKRGTPTRVLGEEEAVHLTKILSCCLAADEVVYEKILHRERGIAVGCYRATCSPYHLLRVRKVKDGKLIIPGKYKDYHSRDIIVKDSSMRANLSPGWWVRKVGSHLRFRERMSLDVSISVFNAVSAPRHKMEDNGEPAPPTVLLRGVVEYLRSARHSQRYSDHQKGELLECEKVCVACADSSAYTASFGSLLQKRD